MIPYVIHSLMRPMKRLREQKGLTQAQVAEAVGVSEGHYQHVEAGRCLPSLPVCARLSRVLGCTVEDFQLWDESQSDPSQRTPRPPYANRRTIEHRTWKNMIRRCCDPKGRNYKHYGGRGITVCDEWRKSFRAFLRDVGPRPGHHYSLGRIDNDKGYFPDNVRWETIDQQNNNRRTTVKLTLNGETLSITQWAQKLRISDSVISSRKSKNLSDEECLRID